MVKVLTGFAAQSPATVLTGRQITRQQYERLVLNQHAIYAEHRARVGGWRWLFTTTSQALTTANDTAGNPDLSYYQPRILLERPQAVSGLEFAVSVYGANYELDVGVYSSGTSIGSLPLTGTATLEWSTVSVPIGGSGLVALDFFFQAMSLDGNLASIYRIIIDEPRIPNGNDTVP